MNLVFFDIECASVNKSSAKICAFGYVLCDESFNVLEKRDILINPKGKFHLTDRHGEKGIVLPYEYTDFKKYPAFPEVYGEIKALLEGENYVFGHAALNDVKFLNLETQRYRLAPFNFRFGDSQLMYMAYIGDFTKQVGLLSIAENLGVEFTAHRAVDDAYASMCIVRALCDANRCTVRELNKVLKLKSGKTENLNVSEPYSEGKREYLKKMESERQLHTKLQDQFAKYLLKKKRTGGVLWGKTFTFSREIEENLPVSKELLDKIYSHGGTYSKHVSKSDYYIVGECDESGRTQFAKKQCGVCVMDVGTFEELIDG